MSISDEPILSGKSDLVKQIEAMLLDAGKACQEMAIKHLSQSCMTGAFKNEIRRVLNQHDVKYTQDGEIDDLKDRIAELEAENRNLRLQLTAIDTLCHVDIAAAEQAGGISLAYGMNKKEPDRPYTAEMEYTAKRLAQWLGGATLLLDSRAPNYLVYGTRGSFHLTVGDMRRFVAAFT